MSTQHVKSIDLFCCIVGGIAIEVAGQFDLKLIEAERNCNFYSNKTIKCYSNKTIQVYFAPFQKDFFSVTGGKRKEFFQHNTELYTLRNEYLYMLHRNRDDGNILWNLVFDSEFSHFEYRLFSKAIKTSDLFELAFNRFLLQHTFINHNGLIIHAAGGSISGKGMVFPAVSGTGKSTLSHLLLPHPENQLFSEERIIMRRLDDGWHLWGTPWKGTGSIARNESAPLSALVFLSQAPETKITPLSTSAALRGLLETVSIPWYSQEWTDKGLAVCESLLRDIPAFQLAFRPDQTAVQAVADLAASLD